MGLNSHRKYQTELISKNQLSQNAQSDVAQEQIDSKALVTRILTPPFEKSQRKIVLKQQKPIIEVSSRYSDYDLNERPLSALSYITKKENEE